MAILASDTLNQSERLKSFTQPHFVSEDATELMTIEVPEPCGADALIGTQDRVKAWAHWGGFKGADFFKCSTA
jgi:hypothetical protein